MRTVIIVVAGGVLIVLAWFYFAYQDLNHFQALVDAEQYRLETEIPRLLEHIPEYAAACGKYFQSETDQKKAQDLNRAVDECASVSKAISATKGISGDEVDRLSRSLKKLYAAYQETRFNPEREKEIIALVEQDPKYGKVFMDVDMGFYEINNRMDYINSLMDWYLKKVIVFPKSIAAGVFGFPRWNRLYEGDRPRT